MPKRDDIKKVMIIGSGPIVIGQACEFDYSGTQACKALRKLGYEIVLANSNPATIMTDPGMADATYIEPLNVQTMTEIIEKERPDALLPNLGGQSGLNLSSELARNGVLEKYGVKMIGVEVNAIERGEDRIAFKDTMNKLGIEMPRSKPAFKVEEAEKIAEELGYPVVIRPAYTPSEAPAAGWCITLMNCGLSPPAALSASIVGQVLVEESVEGWEELGTRGSPRFQRTRSLPSVLLKMWTRWVFIRAIPTVPRRCLPSVPGAAEKTSDSIHMILWKP